MSCGSNTSPHQNQLLMAPFTPAATTGLTPYLEASGRSCSGPKGGRAPGVCSLDAGAGGWQGVAFRACGL